MMCMLNIIMIVTGFLMIISALFILIKLWSTVFLLGGILLITNALDYQNRFIDKNMKIFLWMLSFCLLVLTFKHKPY